MALSLDVTLVRDENIIFRKIEDEYILVPLLSSSDEVEHIYNLNQVGAAVWEKIDGTRTAREIIDELAREYDVTPEQVEKDVMAFLEDIYDSKIIREHNEGN